ncbi:hypothetical protein GCM10025875_24750 [Litorihabitans aurantiacus]|uniref:Sugar-binding domain-containing protein n=2 Tax=Litorihabitans aurantiacus TaxID=1930061 RepID=A0AA38CQS5_9MICO|nr:hypothetical protein GCM10025875_24750 [Litorihabitans aurantiacus]
MRPFRQPVVDQVVQVVGGLGEPRVQMLAARLIGQFASSTGASPVFMPTPGVLGSASARNSLMADSTVTSVMNVWPRLTVALVGIGSVEPSELLRMSGNVLGESDRAALAAAGAVGDICLRFFDADGAPVATGLDERVIGIAAEQLREVPRRVGVAGGERKYAAVRGAVLGGWVNVLVTDTTTAQRLVADRAA